MNDQESLLAAIHEAVQLQDYDPSWLAIFLLERERLLSLFPGIFIDIQHIGSTAVPSFSAKPIVDILAGVDSMRTAEALAEPLCRCGYNTSPEFNATLVDRKWFMRWADGHRTHHLHVVVYGAEPWCERIRFREALLKCPELAIRYAALKTKLAAQHKTDRETYTKAKEQFVRSVSRDV